MLLYEDNTGYKCYIHIPKNSGKYIRNCINNCKSNKIIKNFWGESSQFDYAHIPYVKKDDYLPTTITQKIYFFSYSRNPYDRIISIYFYKNENKTIEDFKMFILNILPQIAFDDKHDKHNIHYYPQYLFVCNKNLEIDDVNVEKIEDVKWLNNRTYDIPLYFSDDMLKIVNDIYKEDFIRFGYKMITNVNEIKN